MNKLNEFSIENFKNFINRLLGDLADIFEITYEYESNNDRFLITFDCKDNINFIVIVISHNDMLRGMEYCINHILEPIIEDFRYKLLGRKKIEIDIKNIELKEFSGNIKARKMTRGEYNVLFCLVTKEGENDKDDGYIIEYLPNCISWSPKEQFENAYRLCDQMTF